MKDIRDAIHGMVTLSPLETQVMDTRPLQRLRHVKQLGFTYLVYPGATHTRFEHSLGVMHLAGKMADALRLPSEAKAWLRVAGLLHDIGHGPFSHTSERTIERFLKVTHEEVTEQLIKGRDVKPVLTDSGIDPKLLIDMIHGRGEYSEILHSELDVDRMDYLIRDSYYTGVAYGVIDLERLICTLKLHNQHLAVTGGTQAAESLLRARFLMYPTVYEHHAARIAEAMFSRAIERCIEKKVFKPQDLYLKDDIDIISSLRHTRGFSKDMIDRIDNRRLFKRAARMTKADVGTNTTNRLINLRNDHKELKRIEAELAKACDLRQGEVIFDIPDPLYTKKELGFLVQRGDQYLPASDVSVSIRTLEEAQWDYWEAMVFAPAGKTDQAKKAVKKVLNIDIKRSSQTRLDEE